RDVGADGQQHRVQQRLASRPSDDPAGLGGQAAAGPVAGRRRTQRGDAGDGPVTAAGGGGRERLAQQRVHGQPGLAEGERQHSLAAAAAAVQGLVRGEGGGYG